jgi:clan AA aspartic protease (TIGR02281 family)
MFWELSAMTQSLLSHRIELTGTRSAAKWLPVAAVASALLIGVSSPSFAGDMGGFFGGVVGGIISNSMQQPPPQPYYQQPQPYYQQPQYSRQPQDPAAAEARRQALARQADLKRQKAQEDKDKKDQEAAARMMPAPAVGTASGPVDVVMKRKDGNLWVPAQINNVVTIDFVIDSGASDITLPRDVYSTLIRSGTLTKANYIGTAQYGIADGSEVKGVKFKLASLQVGNQVLTDVVASVMPSDAATPLLGLSFLSRFQSWSIDNNSGTLKLNPIPSNNPAVGAPTQVAAATPQPLPDLPAAPAATQTGTLAQATVAPTQPEPAIVAKGPSAAEPQVAAAPEAPRSGHVASSALVAKETATPAAAVAPEMAPTTKPNAALPVFPANTPYASARSSLLALGYGPASLPDSGKCDSNTDSTCFPERAACAKADSIQCDFLWRRGEELIKVKTVAVPPTVSAVECQVNCK